MTKAVSSPWAQGAADVARALSSDPAVGLDVAEAAERLQVDGPNELVEAPPTPLWQRVAAQFRDPLVLLLLVAIVVSLIAWWIEGADGTPLEAIVIAAIVILNAGLGFWQEARTIQAVAALQQMAALHSTVIRGGEVERVFSTKLVVGDVVLLAEGDAVGADCRLIETAGFDVSEAALTGESAPVTKTTDPISVEVLLADRTNMVFSGTAVTRGRGRGVVVSAGMDTEMGRIAALLDSADSGETPLQKQIGWLGRMLGIVVVALSAVVVGAVLLTSEDRSFSGVIDALVIGVSLAVAAVPEGLPAIVSVVLALGVQRMAEHNAIVKRLSSVETLGSASVICTDKTGTLTRNEMTIVKVVAGGVEVDLTGVGYHPFGEARLQGEPITDEALLTDVQTVLGAGSLANDAALVATTHDSWEVRGDPTEAAFLVAERKVGDADVRTNRFERISEVPFTSERKMMTTLNRDATAEAGELVVVTKGAPDVLVSRCTHVRDRGVVAPMSDQRRSEVLSDVDRLGDEALRTLAVAYRGVDSAVAEIDEGIEQDLVYLGVVGIIDPPRDEVADSIDQAHSAGVRLVMITGDHPRTAQRIADQLDIDEVHARVNPDDKLRIVEDLQAEGHIVAMTGDGVNDAPALRRADIGVAMGISGTEVSKEAADVILADDNFATILRAVREGREIFSDIRKVLRYLLASNSGEVLVMLIGVLAASWLGLHMVDGEQAVPLLATQILWINLLTDGTLAMALGVDPAVDDVMKRRPRRMDSQVIDKPMFVTIGLIGLVSAAVALLALDIELPGGLIEGSGDITTARTMVFTTLVLSQILNAYNSRSDRISAFVHPFENRYLLVAAAVTLLLQIAVVHISWLNQAFDTTPLDASRWLLCAGLAVVVLAAGECRKLVSYWLRSRSG